MSTDANKPKLTRVHKAKYTDQDVRTHALEARDELMANLEFLMEAIREDRYKLQRYKDKFGDLKYRPIVSPGKPEHSIEPVYGNPTEANIEPLASVYRATINSLLQSIRLIQSEIISEDNPEGATATRKKKDEDELTTKRRQSLRSEFSAAQSTASVPEPVSPVDDDSDELPTELVPKAKPTHIAPSKPAMATPKKPEGDSNPKPTERPWRTKPQAVLVKADVETEPETKAPTEDPKPKVLQNPEKLDPESERIRADLNRLRSGAGSRMGALAKKYAKQKKDDED